MSYLKPTKSSLNKAYPRAAERNASYSAMSGGSLNSSTGSASGAPKMSLKAVKITNRLSQSKKYDEVNILQKHLEQSKGTTMPRLHQPKASVPEIQAKTTVAQNQQKYYEQQADEFKPMTRTPTRTMGKKRRSLAERRDSDSEGQMSGRGRLNRKDSLTRVDIEAATKIALPSKIKLERSNSKVKVSSGACSEADSMESITKINLNNLKSQSQVVESPSPVKAQQEEKKSGSMVDEFSAKKQTSGTDEKARNNSSTRKKWNDKPQSQVSFALEKQFSLDQASEQASEVSFSPNKKSHIIAASQNDLRTNAGGSSVDAYSTSQLKKSSMVSEEQERKERTPDRKRWAQTPVVTTSPSKNKLFDECDDIGADEEVEGIADLKQELERQSEKSRPSESPGKRKQWTSVGMQERQNDILRLKPAILVNKTPSEESDEEKKENSLFDPPKEKSDKDLSLIQAQEALRDQLDASLEDKKSIRETLPDVSLYKSEEGLNTMREEDDDIENNYKALFLQNSLSQIDDRFESEVDEQSRRSIRLSEKDKSETKLENSPEVADNSYLFNYLEQHYENPNAKDPDQEIMNVSQNLGRPLTLQEKIELKKLNLLKKQGKKKEYDEYLSSSHLMGKLDGSMLLSNKKNSPNFDSQVSPDFIRQSRRENNLSEDGFEDRIFAQLDQTDDFEMALRNYKHLELDEVDEPDLMYAILFDASHQNHWDDHDFDFDQVLFEEKKRDDFESFDEFKLHKSKKMQINFMLTQKQQKGLINAKKKNAFNITNTVNKIFGYFGTKSSKPRIQDLITQKMANRKAKKLQTQDKAQESIRKLQKNEKLSKEELRQLQINLATLSLKKFKITARRWSARKDNQCHHAPDVDPFNIRDHHKKDQILKQIDAAITTNIKWKLIGVEHPSESPKKTIFAATAVKKKPVGSTKSPMSRARSRSPVSNNTSYLGKAPINDQWYKYVFEELNVSVEQPEEESLNQSGAPIFVNLQFQQEIRNLSSHNDPGPAQYAQTHRKQKSSDLFLITPEKKSAQIPDPHSSPEELQVTRQTLSNHSRFTLHSNLSHFQNVSSFRLKHINVSHESPGYLMRKQRSSHKSMTSVAGNYKDRDNQIIPGLTSAVFYPPEDCIEKLPTLISLLGGLDVLLFIRLIWLLSPILKPTTIKKRLFKIPSGPELEEPIQQATKLYLQDDLKNCIKYCSKFRQVYLKQKSYGFKKAQFQLDSREVAKIYIIELACMVEQINLEPENEKILKVSHELIESIPMIVKSREQHQFTILEIFLRYNEKKAFSKLKDIDFISYKLFKLHNTMCSSKSSYAELDTDEQKSPEQYCKDIQEQFNKVSQDEYLKQLQFFIFGCLSALKNNHFYEAFSFINQAPIVCNFSENDSFQTIIYFEMFKMVETKLLTKIGRPEQAVVMLANQYFEQKQIQDEQFNRIFPFSLENENLATFDEQIYLCPKWTIYKILKYQLKLMEFRQDHFKFKMIQSSQNGLQLQKANDDFCNILSHLRFLFGGGPQFQWLLFKTFLKIERQNKIVGMMQNENFQMIYNLVNLLKIGKDLLVKEEIQSKLKKKYNGNLVDYFFKSYSHGRQNEPNENFNENEEGDQIFAQEKSFVSKIIQNQAHFYLILQNILDFVKFKLENMYQSIKNDTNFNYFDKLKDAEQKHLLTANLSHAMHIILNCVNMLVFHDIGNSKFNIDVIYINEKQFEQDTFLNVPNSKHVASFGKEDFEGGSEEGAPHTSRSSIYQTMKVDYFNQKYQNPDQKEEGYSNRYIRMAQYQTNFEHLNRGSAAGSRGRASPKFGSLVKSSVRDDPQFTLGDAIFDSPRNPLPSENGFDSSRHFATHRNESPQVEEIEENEEEAQIEQFIETEEEKTYFSMLNQSIYCADTLYALLTACCLSDSNQKLAIKISQTLIKYNRNKGKKEVPPYMRSIDVVLAFIYLRLNHKQYQKQQSENKVRGAGFKQRESTSKSENSNVKILSNLQTQDYFLQQSLRHFKMFNADKHLKSQNLMIVTMYIHVQKELVSYKLLSDHFAKNVVISAKGVNIEKSKYQQHQIRKLEGSQQVEKGALALFTERERSKSISLFESQ